MKIKLLVLTILLTFSLVACEKNESIIENNKVDAIPDEYGTFEWVSPDGVHYWVIEGVYRYGIAPRYDSNGELVIDKE